MAATECAAPRGRTGREGFTLIEVLAAMVILAIGLLALEAMGIGAARAVARADAQSEYIALATDRLERTLTRVDQGQAVASGTETVDGAQVATVVAADNAGGRSVFTVTVTVTPPSGGRAVPPQPVTVVGRAIR